MRSLPRQGSEYDQWCLREFAILREKIKPYVVEMTMPCPYGLPHTARFSQATFERLTDRQLEIFLAAGYRRNGNSLYTMRCWDCRACIPIRLRTDQFQPNRGQRRAWKRNQDLDVSFGELELDIEHLELCDFFLQTRYPRERNRAYGYYGEFFCNTVANTRQVQFRLGDSLLGASIIDVGENFMNAVYFYFDPSESWRGLGTFNILSLVRLCRELEIGYLYLGYYIAETRAMRYKAAFKPHQLLLGEQWAEKLRGPESSPQSF